MSVIILKQIPFLRYQTKVLFQSILCGVQAHVLCSKCEKKSCFFLHTRRNVLNFKYSYASNKNSKKVKCFQILARALSVSMSFLQLTKICGMNDDSNNNNNNSVCILR